MRGAPQCGQPGHTREDVADLQLTWLILATVDGADQAVTARFHRTCAPAAVTVEDYARGTCGDGPLLAGALAQAQDLTLVAAIDTTLERLGWTTASPTCPGCSRACRPRSQQGYRRAQ